MFSWYCVPTRTLCLMYFLAHRLRHLSSSLSKSTDSNFETHLRKQLFTISLYRSNASFSCCSCSICCCWRIIICICCICCICWNCCGLNCDWFMSRVLLFFWCFLCAQKKNKQPLPLFCHVALVHRLSHYKAWQELYNILFLKKFSAWERIKHLCATQTGNKQPRCVLTQVWFPPLQPIFPLVVASKMLCHDYRKCNKKYSHQKPLVHHRERELKYRSWTFRNSHSPHWNKGNQGLLTQGCKEYHHSPIFQRVIHPPLQKGLLL